MVIFQRTKLTSTVRFLRSITSSSSVHSKCPAASTAEKTVYPEGWDQAKGFKEIPGPSVFQLLRGFMPGGDYYDVTPAEWQKRVFEKYGPLVRIPGVMGKPTMVMSFDADHFEPVYRTEGATPFRRSLEAFCYYRQKVRPEVFNGLGGLVSDQGETWHKLRSAVSPIMLPLRVARSYVPDVDTVSRDFVRRLHRLRDENGELPATFGRELNLWAMESIGLIAMDRRLGVLDNDRDADADLLIQTVNEFFVLSYDIEMKPSMWRYYHNKQFKRLLKVFDNMTDLAMKYVKEAVQKADKEKATSDGTERTTELSVLQKLMNVNRDYAMLMSFDTLFAGIDTTSSTAATLLYHLAKHPEYQEKLREEVFRVLPDREKGLLSKDVDHMPYMRACLRESMRVQPITQAHTRGTGQPLILDGYQIPKMTDIIMASLLMVKDEKHFKEADQFKPERWLRDAIGKKSPSKNVNPFAFLPFGYGPRSCVGQRFAETEIVILLTRILRDYRIEWHYGLVQYSTALIHTPTSDLKFKFIPL